MKTLHIEDELVHEVIAALATRAKMFEKWLEEHSASADLGTAIAWQKASDDLWALVRQLGV